MKEKNLKMNISSDRIKCLIILLIFLFSNTSFAREIDKKQFMLDLITKMSAKCNTNIKYQDCYVFYQKTQFTIGSSVEKTATLNDNVSTIMGLGLNTFFSMGAIIPIFLIMPKDVNIFGESYKGNAVSITGAKVIDLIPAANQQIKVLFNGFDFGEYLSDDKGHFSINSNESGVYELISYSNQLGVALNQSFLISK